MFSYVMHSSVIYLMHVSLLSNHAVPDHNCIIPYPINLVTIMCYYWQICPYLNFVNLVISDWSVFTCLVPEFISMWCHVVIKHFLVNCFFFSCRKYALEFVITPTIVVLLFVNSLNVFPCSGLDSEWEWVLYQMAIGLNNFERCWQAQEKCCMSVILLFSHLFCFWVRLMHTEAKYRQNSTW